MRIVFSQDLSAWGRSSQGPSDLPLWISRLIESQVDAPKDIRFPSGKEVFQSGADGWLHQDQVDTPYIPRGGSWWELSTQTSVERKANEDYAKRTAEIPEETRRRITYVSVTTNSWGECRTWARDKQGLGEWKSVLGLDVTDLERWFELAPSVAIRFTAEVRGTHLADYDYLDHAWEIWRNETDPPISEQLVTVARQNEEKQILDWLNGAGGALVVKSDSPWESYGFVLATLRRIENQENRDLAAMRTLVARDYNAASQFENRSHLIILIKDVKEQFSASLWAQNSHVILPIGNDSSFGNNVVTLSTPWNSQFAQSLSETVGLTEEEAHRKTRECGRSVTVLRRTMKAAHSPDPNWSVGSEIRALIPAVLAGRWSENRNADKTALAKLAGVSDYDQVEQNLHPFLNIDDPPLEKLGDVWGLRAAPDAFTLAARHITRGDLSRFKETFEHVFTSIELRDDNSFEDLIQRDDDSIHSSWIIGGLAETLLLIAQRGPDAGLSCVPDPHLFANSVVKDIPGLDDDWRTLARISKEFRRLVEAAPSPLLEALENLLRSHSGGLVNIFREDGFFGGGSFHTEILWGLEAMAWSSEFLSRVSLILAGLARIDPGGSTTNRPLNSLVEIFLPWRPSTFATISEQLAVIDQILEQDSKVGWELIGRLLPGATTVAGGTTEPRWRDRGNPPEGFKTRASLNQVSIEILKRVLERIGTIPVRWQALLDCFPHIDLDLRRESIAAMTSCLEGNIEEENRTAIWDILRKFVTRHRRFPVAEWAMSDQELQPFDEIIKLLGPEDTVRRHLWLFNEYLPDLPSEREDFEEQDRIVAELRIAAIDEILDQFDIKGLVRLGTRCRCPPIFAEVAVQRLGSVPRVASFLDLALSAGEAGLSLASHISGSAAKALEDQWARWIGGVIQSNRWPPNIAASLLVWWPEGEDTWNFVDSLGEEVQKEYWSKVSPLMVRLSTAEQVRKIRELAVMGRAAESIHLIAHAGKDLPTDSLLNLFDAAMKEVAQTSTEEEFRRICPPSYDLRKLLELLQGRSDVTRDDLAQREYLALQILGYGDTGGLVVHQILVEDPKFFVDVICDVYLPDNRSVPDDQQPTPTEKAKARIAYRLLDGLTLIPGLDAEFVFDAKSFSDWVTEVRKLSASTNRFEIAEDHIGRILAHCPADPDDGIWPRADFRNVIEELNSDIVDEAFRVQHMNMRGVTTRGLFDGGEQERDLSDRYTNWSDIIKVRWPRTSKILHSLSESYHYEAQRQDDHARQRDLH